MPTSSSSLSPLLGSLLSRTLSCRTSSPIFIMHLTAVTAHFKPTVTGFTRPLGLCTATKSQTRFRRTAATWSSLAPFKWFGPSPMESFLKCNDGKPTSAWRGAAFHNDISKPHNFRWLLTLYSKGLAMNLPSCQGTCTPVNVSIEQKTPVTLTKRWTENAPPLLRWRHLYWHPPPGKLRQSQIETVFTHVGIWTYCGCTMLVDPCPSLCGRCLPPAPALAVSHAVDKR